MFEVVIYDRRGRNLTTEGEGKLDSIDRTLREILKWTRFANISKLKETLEIELVTDEKKIAFENSDGVNGLKELTAASGAPQDTIYGWWQKWFRLGLVIQSEERKGRMMRIVSLDDIGIKIPKKLKVSPSPEITTKQEVVPSQSEITEKETE